MNRRERIEAQLGGVAAEAAMIAIEAGRLVNQIRSEGVEPRAKEDGSTVTRADTESNDLICGRLESSFPGDGLLSEERPGWDPGSTGRVWVVDPLDGTSGFAKGKDEYAIHLGLLEAGEPIVGVVFEPATGRLWVASRGAGAWAFGERDEEPTAGRLRPLDQDRTPRLVTSSRMPDEDRQLVAQALNATDLGRVSSVGVKVGRLVAGEADVYVSAHPISYWDSCAPFLVLQESGGAVAMAGHQPFRYDRSESGWAHPAPFVASVSDHHREHLEAVQRVLGW